MTREQIARWVDEHGPWLHRACSPETAEEILRGDEGILPDPDERDDGDRPFLSSRRDCAYIGTAEYLGTGCPIRIDIRRLDPEKLVIDEDMITLHPEAWGPDVWGPEVEPPFPDPRTPGSGAEQMTLGEWIERVGLDTPENVERSLRLGALAVKDGVPREAIEPAGQTSADECA